MLTQTLERRTVVAMTRKCDFLVFDADNHLYETIDAFTKFLPDRYRNVVGIFMNQILHGRPMTIFGDGTQTRAFCYIGDVAPIMAEALEVPAARNGIFNIGADVPCSLNDLAHAVAAAMDVRADVIHLPPRHEVRHAHSAHEKIRAVFGARPQTSLQDGLATMAAKKVYSGEEWLSADLCVRLHRIMARARAMEERMIKMSKSGEAYFWIGGPGEEVANERLPGRDLLVREHIPRPDLEAPRLDQLPHQRVPLRSRAQVVLEHDRLPVEQEGPVGGVRLETLDEIVQHVHEPDVQRRPTGSEDWGDDGARPAAAVA